jgi:hypothetical protein
MIYLFILEDITSETHRHRDWETPGGVGPLAQCMFMGQKLGMGVACVSHTLSGLSPIIRQNIRIWLVFGLPGEEPRLICNTLRATTEEADRIKGLMPGEMVLYNPAIIQHPVYAKFEQLQVPGQLEESQRRHMVENFLKKTQTSPPSTLSVFKSIPPTKADTKDKQPLLKLKEMLSSPQNEMLVRIATGATEPMCGIYQQMGVSRAQGRRIVKPLISMGLIIIHSLPTGRRGGRLSLPEITDCGWQILVEKGISRPRPKTKGGFMHELAARLIEACEKGQSRTVRFEIDVGGRRLDVESIDNNTGNRTLFNIGITDPKREADNIEAILKLPVIQTSKLIFVAHNKKFAHEVQKILTSKDTTGSLLKQVEMKTIADFVNI